MSANFTPNMHSYSDQAPFRYWVQKVLPLVYDDSLSYYELLNKVVQFLNNVIDTANDLTADMTALYTAYGQLQDYVNEYFDNLDLSSEVDHKLDEMVADGTIPQIINTYLGDHIGAYVTAWLNDHPEATTTVQDGSITNAKLVQSGGILSDVETLKDILDIKKSGQNVLYNNSDFPRYLYTSNIPTTGSLNIYIPWNALEYIGGSSIHKYFQIPDYGGYRICLFDINASAVTGNNIISADVTAKLVQINESDGNFSEAMSINASSAMATSYHWDGSASDHHWSFVFGVPSVDEWVGLHNKWLIKLEFSNIVDAVGATNALIIKYSDPWFCNLGTITPALFLEYVNAHWSDQAIVSATISDIQHDIADLQNTIATLQLDAMPQLSSSDIATIIGNVN